MNLNHFPKKAFETWSFLTNIFPSKVHPFLKNSFHFLRIFSHLHKLSGDFQILSSEFPERLISIFFLKNAFQLQMFLSIHHVFPTYILQNRIAHAWILCAFRIEHNFDDFTKSSTFLVLGSITPAKGGRNGRTSYRQVEPHPMDFPAIFKTEASISKQISKIRSSLTRERVFLSLPQGKRRWIFATITTSSIHLFWGHQN